MHTGRSRSENVNDRVNVVGAADKCCLAHLGMLDWSGKSSACGDRGMGVRGWRTRWRVHHMSNHCDSASDEHMRQHARTDAVQIHALSERCAGCGGAVGGGDGAEWRYSGATM